MKQTFLLIFISTVFFIPCSSQDKKSIAAEVTEIKPLIKIIKREGWGIPKFEERYFLFYQGISIDGRTVTRRGQFFFQKGIDFQLDFYFLSADNTLITEAKQFKVRAVMSYAVNEKIFAYHFNFVPAGPLQQDSKESKDAGIIVFYFDEDGDGKFETRYLSNELPRKIPGWVTEN